ncbi:lipase family protein [Phenylobacterium sp. SCN 70-31]|uniref:lipase family protein n=1 Tax=Phenylobacterium sp. SCN 70-31 TaxID=1660129 RepID=UPI00086DE4A4|nr:lipase family protein [Phenylobacterium sp. SCN 70-31]ODT87143.1 MAG: signal peptide-containing protein [Phenylobacterium sp. SCN 70-31]
MRPLLPVLAMTTALLLSATPTLGATPDARFGDGGVSAFYDWSGPIQRPGKLLRQEPLPPELVLSEAGQGVRILYTSTDGIGGAERVVVSGAYFTPKGKPPKGGWPLVAWAHGTVGLADVCAPSWAGRSARDTDYLNRWLSEGFAVVASDYQGIGTAGPHGYMMTRPVAYSVLDSIRAVVASQRGLSRKVILVGQSQGASAAFTAAGFAATYAPELDIRGVVSTGTPYVSAKKIDATKTYSDGSRVDPTIAYAFYLTLTLQQLRPDIAASDIYTDKAMPLLESARSMCIRPLVQAVVDAGLTSDNAFKGSQQAQAFMPFLPHFVYPTLKLHMPIFMGAGTADKDVAPSGQMQLAREACDAGTVVEAHLYEGLDHSGTVNASLKDSLPFVRKVLHGEPIAPRCAPQSGADVAP